VIRIQPLKYLGRFLLHELPGSRFPKEMGSFLLQHQMASPCNVAISQNMSAVSSKRFKSTSELRRPLQDRGASRASSSLKRGSSRITRSANDHQVAAGLFECFFRCGDLILWAKTFALYEIIPRPERPREQFPGLLRARFVRFRLGNHMVGAEGAPALGLVIRISGRTTPPALVR
jgi:hypothetical protein